MENLKSKEELRVEVAKALLTLSDSRRLQASRNAFELLRKRFLEHTSILSFVPMHDELDIGPLNEILSKSNKLLLPRVEGDDLLIYHCKPLDNLQRSSLGILEPSVSLYNLVNPKDISLALIPGRAFSKEKDRLGRGGGYYDRFLEKYPHIYKIGIGYSEQLINEPFAHTHDQKMDELLLF